MSEITEAHWVLWSRNTREHPGAPLDYPCAQPFYTPPRRGDNQEDPDISLPHTPIGMAPIDEVIAEMIGQMVTVMADSGKYPNELRVLRAHYEVINDQVTVGKSTFWKRLKLARSIVEFAVEYRLSMFSFEERYDFENSGVAPLDEGLVRSRS